MNAAVEEPPRHEGLRVPPPSEEPNCCRASEKLSSGEQENFHKIVAKGLFLSKRARPDIQPAIAFLCARVKNPTMQDKEKPHRMRLCTYAMGARFNFRALLTEKIAVGTPYGRQFCAERMCQEFAWVHLS